MAEPLSGSALRMLFELDAQRDAKRGDELDRELVRANIGRSLFGAVAPVRRGRFEIMQRLGEGATGLVYEAHDLERNEKVALKCLTRMDDDGVYRIKQEFRALADLSHPNIVTLHELFNQDGWWFFTMELVAGAQFHAYIASATDAEARYARARDASAQLCAALSALHAAGKLHRDLKPSNVLVKADGTLKLLDFGLAREQMPLAGAPPVTGVRGTPAYMAPEQALGRPAEASDWYAMGVMLFESLSGRLPFQGDAEQLLRAKKKLDAPSLKTLCEGVPDDLLALCDGLLKRQPEDRLDGAAVQQLLGCAQADAARDSAIPPASAARVFVGRERELGQLQDAMRDAAEGAARLLLIAGRSGIGKSALLDRFEELSGADILRFRGRCYEQESMPFKVFDGIADALRQYLTSVPDAELPGLLPVHFGALSRLFPVLAKVPAPRAQESLALGARELRKQGFVALKELLQRLSQRRPLALIVDDLQWGDADSAHMLAHLFSPPAPSGLLFLGAYRSEDVAKSEFLQRALTPHELHDAVQPTALELGPLSPDRSVELSRRLLNGRELTEAEASAIAAESHGIPFFIFELSHRVEHLPAAQGQPSPSQASAESAPVVSLEGVILERAGTLPSNAMRLLEVLSVAAGPLERAIAFDAASLQARSHADAVLRAARLMRSCGSRPMDAAETYHDRIRETVARSLTPARRREIHAAIAAAMLAHGLRDPERLFRHHRGAGELQLAGQAALLAAESAAAKLAFNHAAELFAQALSCLSQQESIEHGVHARLGEALANAGRSVEAADAYLKGAQHASGSHGLHLQHRAGEHYLRSGRGSQGLPLVRRTLREVKIRYPDGGLRGIAELLFERARLELQPAIRRRRLPAPTSRAKARLAHARADLLRDVFPSLSGIDPLASTLLQTRYLREALQTGDPEKILWGLVWEVFNVALVGGARNEQRAARALTMVKDACEKVATPHATAMLHFAEASWLLWSGHRYVDSMVPAARAREILTAECRGVFWERAVATFMQLVAMDFVGDLNDYAELSLETVREASERDDRYSAFLMLQCVPNVHNFRDDPSSAMAFLDKQRTWIGTDYNTFRHLWLLRMVETCMHQGAALEAQALMRQEWPKIVRSQLFRCRTPRESLLYYRARVEMAVYIQAPGAQTKQQALRALKTIEGTQSLYRAWARLIHAGLSQAEGKLSVAVEHAQAARAHFLSCQAPLLARYAERRLCELRGDASALREIDNALKQQGIADPARWIWGKAPHLQR